MAELDEAERRFAAYLDDHGYSWKHEPDYQTELGLAAPLTTKPAFLFERDELRAVGGVRQFATTQLQDALEKAGGYMSAGPKQAYGPLRRGIIETATQLRPLTGAGMPLLIVLANPLHADALLDPPQVQTPCGANPGFVIPIDLRTGGQAESQEAFWSLEDYGAFASPVKENDRVMGLAEPPPARDRRGGGARTAALGRLARGATRPLLRVAFRRRRPRCAGRAPG